MLLRQSEIAEEMEKIATIINTLGRIGGALGKAGKFLKKNDWKWGKRLGGAAAITGVTGAGLAEVQGQSRGGLGQRSFALRQQGLIPEGLPKIPEMK